MDPPGRARRVCVAPLRRNSASACRACTSADSPALRYRARNVQSMNTWLNSPQIFPREARRDQLALAVFQVVLRVGETGPEAVFPGDRDGGGRRMLRGNDWCVARLITVVLVLSMLRVYADEAR
jgi:hypothetical protein